MSRREAARSRRQRKRAALETTSSPDEHPQQRAGQPATRCWFEGLAAVLGALVLTTAAYAPAFSARFVSDDINAIVENEHVSGAFDPHGIVSTFSWWGEGRSDSAGYRPATTLSFALNHLTTGPEPEGFRAVNFVLNAVCAGLLLALARALGLGLGASTAAAAVFAVLPIHSEAAIWIVGRAELGAAAAFLAACLACLAHVRSGGLLPLALAAAAIALGMAFKENAVTVLAAPVIFHVLLPRDDASARRAAISFAALLTGLAAYALLRSLASGPPIAGAPSSLLDNPLSVVDPVTRLLGALAVLGRYVLLTLWPSSLSVDYSWNALGIGPGFLASSDSLVAVAFLAGCALAAWRGPGKREVVAVGLVLALASYSIVSNTVFVIGTILGERLFYLPSAGLSLALAAMIDGSFRGGSRRSVVTAAAVALVVLACIGVDRRRSRDWLTPVSLFEAAVAAVPGSARAHMELASAYGNVGRVDDAERHFRLALERKPDYTAAAYNEGNALARARRYDEAAAAYRRALAIEPDFTRAWHNLALTEKIRGNAGAWAEALQGAARSAPASPSLQNEVGEALLAAGRYAEAVATYDAIVAGGNAAAAAYFNRGVAHHHLGGCAAAVEDYRLATTVSDPPQQAFAAAAGCLKELGRSEEAAAVGEAAKVANRGTRR